VKAATGAADPAKGLHHDDRPRRRRLRSGSQLIPNEQAQPGCLYPGSLVSFDDDKPRQEPGTLMTLTAGNLQSLAGRLEQRAGVIVLAQSLSAEDLLSEDLRTAARLCPACAQSRMGWQNECLNSLIT
jgi:hypothetical protein